MGTHLVSMLFCQFARSQSVRDISNGLRSATGNLNHLGVKKAPSKSTVSYQNKHRDWKLFKDYYFELQKSLGQQAGFKQVKFKIKSKVFLLDSSTISLCLSLFDWAKYKTSKGAIKMHTLLDYDGNLPAYVNITDGKTADNKGAYEIPLLKRSVIVADRFYNDFSLLNVWDSNKVYFVIRHKDNIRFRTIKENDLRPAYSSWYSIQNIQVTKTFKKGWNVYAGVKNLLNFTPPAYSILRANDPFDKDVNSPDNPYGYTFDPTYVYAANQGIRGFLGVRYSMK